MTNKFLFIFLLLVLLLPMVLGERKISLQSREFFPGEKDGLVISEKVSRMAVSSELNDSDKNLSQKNKLVENLDQVHLLIQFDYMPDEGDKEDLEDYGILLLDYIPDYTWLASVDSDIVEDLLDDRDIT